MEEVKGDGEGVGERFLSVYNFYSLMLINCLPSIQAKSCPGNLSQYLWRNLNISPSIGMMSKLFIMWKFSSPQRRRLGLSLLLCGQGQLFAIPEPPAGLGSDLVQLWQTASTSSSRRDLRSRRCFLGVLEEISLETFLSSLGDS